jgi:uncharacterized membrane protein
MLFTFTEPDLLVNIRIVSGTAFLLFIPGYTLTKALFINKKKSNLEIFVMSFGTSIALVTMLSFLLDQIRIGMDQSFVTLALFAVVQALSSYSLLHEFTSKIPIQNTHTSDLKYRE